MLDLGKKYFKRYHPKYGAIVLIEPRTGRILFPAASIFKTITAAAAIEKAGVKAKSIIRTTGRNHTLYKFQLEKELDQFREVTFQEAFAYSINPVFGRLGLHILGADGLQEYALKFGFNAEIPFELKNGKPIFIYPDTAFAVAELASGFNKSTMMSPLFGAMITAGISNNGQIYAPTIIDSIIDLKTNNTIYKRKNTLWRVPVQKSTAHELVELMRHVARYGTARKSFKYIKQSYRFEDTEYGGKTGNIDKNGLGKVDWFVGFCRHKEDSDQHVAIGVVTVHDDNWTVHSSYIGAEIMRKYIRKIQITKKQITEQKPDSTSVG